MKRTWFASLIAISLFVAPLSGAYGRSDDEDGLSQLEMPRKTRKKKEKTPAKEIDELLLGDEEEAKPKADVDPKTRAANEIKIKDSLLLEKKSDFAGVVTILQPLTDTLSRQGLMILARAYAKTAQTVFEIKTLELCLAKNPKDYVVQSLLGHAYARTKRYDDAVVAFQESRKLNARYQPPYDGLLAEYERTEDRYEARILLADMIKTFGPQPRYYTTLCRLYTQENFLEKAVEACQAAIEKDPKIPENYVYLGQGLRDQEELEEANEVLDKAARRFPASEVIQSSAGELKAFRKDYAASYRYFKLAVAADPKSPRAQIGLANSAFELQKNEEALSSYLKACSSDRKMTKDLKIAITKLRTRKDIALQSRFENVLANCNER